MSVCVYASMRMYHLPGILIIHWPYSFYYLYIGSGRQKFTVHSSAAVCTSDCCWVATTVMLSYVIVSNIAGLWQPAAGQSAWLEPLFYPKVDINACIHIPALASLLWWRRRLRDIAFAKLFHSFLLRSLIYSIIFPVGWSVVCNTRVKCLCIKV